MFNSYMDLVGYSEPDCKTIINRWQAGNFLLRGSTINDILQKQKFAVLGTFYNLYWVGANYNDGSGIRVVIGDLLSKKLSDNFYVNVWNSEGYSDQPIYYDNIVHYDSPNHFPEYFRGEVNRFFRSNIMYINKRRKEMKGGK